MHIHDAAQDLAAEALSIVPHAEHAGIGVVYHGQLIASLAATDECSHTFDTLQRRHRQGPYLEITDDHDVVLINDLLRESRWPDIVAAAIAHTPLRSMLALTLCRDDHFRWILELSADTPHAFTDQDLQRAMSWATGQRGHLSDTGCCRGVGDDTAAAALLARRFALDPPAAFALLIQIDNHVANRSPRPLAARHRSRTPG